MYARDFHRYTLHAAPYAYRQFPDLLGFTIGFLQNSIQDPDSNTWTCSDRINVTGTTGGPE